MRTLKWLKTAAVLQAVFVFSCVSSNVCFALYRRLDMRVFFNIATVLLYGWMVNPTGPLTLIVGLNRFLSERRNPEYREQIGKKWLWFPAWFVFDLLLYLAAIMAMVALTGGV